ncbi:hypothetical protein [Prolixibacter denitrificans]|uniref:Uncharacterized protein n=1 Tax=Prolixibacter denitrificans TaxID=1541063 RepID=A0ABQ0ZNG0_9BACT|nr:hypothetical protein [Prolixibacter denitrificans]GET22976.1 hypothetical protein JCM18694_32220 [Prolixibacter denitrificans]
MGWTTPIRNFHCKIPILWGTHGTDDEKEKLDNIIKAVNERFYAGWEEAPEEARVKFSLPAYHTV